MLPSSTFSTAWRRRLRQAGIDGPALKEIQRFRELASHLETAVWMVTPDFSETLFVNPSFERLVGIPSSLVSDAPQSFFDLVHSEELPSLNRAIRQLCAGSMSDSVIEYRVNLPSGEQRWLRTNLVAVRDERGQVDCIALYSERRRIRQKEWSRQKWRYEMFDRLPQLLWVSGPEGGCVHVNRAWREFTGRDLELESGKGWKSLLHPEDAASYLACYWSAFKERTHFTHECRLRREDGEYRWLQLRGAPWNDENRQFGGFIVSGVDVSEARRSKDELNDAHELLTAAIETTSAGILVADAPAKTIRVANSAALRILGLQSFETLDPSGQWYRLFLPDEGRLAPEDAPLSRAIDQGETVREMEVVVERRDGKRRNVLVNAAPILNDGRIMAGIAVFTDITDRKAAEAESVRFRQILDATLDFVGIADAKARLIYLNRAGRRMVGLAEDADVSDVRLTDLVVEAERTRFEESALAGAALDGVWKGEVRLRGQGAQPLPTSQVVIGQRGRGGSGAVEFYAAIGRDISEQQRSALALATHAESLERSNEELERFAYVASHDLQEPLRMVASYTRLLQDRYASFLDEAANEFIEYAVDGADRMQKLIEALLSFSRLGTHGQAFESVNCQTVFDRAKENLRLAIEEAGARIDAAPLPRVPGDASQLGQLFQNLLANAIKFRSDEAPVVGLRVEELAEEWHFSMQDNGIGLEPIFAERIFQIFQRLHLRDEYPGTGVGLALCKRIVERHGGRIWVESHLGMGACFHFTISKIWTEELT